VNSKIGFGQDVQVRHDLEHNRYIANIKIDMGKFQNSQLGKLMIPAAINSASGELGTESEATIASLNKSLGFDFADQEAMITAIITEEDGIWGMVSGDLQLKDSIGNLKSLVQSLPGYKATKLKGQDIDVAMINGQLSHFVFRDGLSGQKHLTISDSKSNMICSLDELGTNSDIDLTHHSMPKDQFLSVRFVTGMDEAFGLPDSVASLMSDVNFSLGQSNKDIDLTINVTGKNEAAAAKLQQFLQGVATIIELCPEIIRLEISNRTVSSQILAAIGKAEVNRTDDALQVKVKVAESLLLQFLKNETSIEL
jgi:hypothetical protein